MICDFYTWKLLRRGRRPQPPADRSRAGRAVGALDRRLDGASAGLYLTGARTPVPRRADSRRAAREDDDVALRTLASQVEAMRSYGLDAEPIDPAIERIEHDDFGTRTPIGAQQRVVRTFCRRAKLDAQDLRGAIEKEHPDVLLVDIASWGAMAAAEERGEARGRHGARILFLCLARRPAVRAWAASRERGAGADSRLRAAPTAVGRTGTDRQAPRQRDPRALWRRTPSRMRRVCSCRRRCCCI